MIVDTSALVAILLREPGHERIVTTLLTESSQISAATLVEARIVTLRYLGVAGRRRLDALLAQADVEVAPFDERQADVAAEAYRDYGKGSGHPAQLNLGDTFAYALAHVADEPLLFVGEDFSRTDIRSALPG